MKSKSYVYILFIGDNFTCEPDKKSFLNSNVLQNIHRKTPVLESLSNKVTRPLACNLVNRCFPENIATFLRTVFLTEHLWWLLRKFQLS